MKRTLLFATLVLSISVTAAFTQVTAVQQQQQATTPPATTGTVGTFDITAKPVYEVTEKKVATYGKAKKAPARKPTGSRIQRTEKLTGWEVSGQFVVPPAAPAATMQQQQQVVNVNAIDENINGVKLRVTALEDFKDEQVLTNQKLAGAINAVDGKVNTLNANFQQYVVGNEKNIQALDRRLTAEEQKSDDTTGFLDYLNLGLNLVNTGMNIHQYKQINDLKKGNKSSKNQGNHGNGGNQCWRNGKYVCQTGGIKCPPGQVQGQNGCHNVAVGGNCLIRGNCNYGNTNTSSGPVSVPNCPYGATSAYCTGGYNGNASPVLPADRNSSSFSNILFGNRRSSSSQGYNSSSNNGGGGNVSSGLYNTSRSSGRRYN